MSSEVKEFIKKSGENVQKYLEGELAKIDFRCYELEEYWKEKEREELENKEWLERQREQKRKENKNKKEIKIKNTYQFEELIENKDYIENYEWNRMCEMFDGIVKRGKKLSKDEIKNLTPKDRKIYKKMILYAKELGKSYTQESDDETTFIAFLIEIGTFIFAYIVCGVYGQSIGWYMILLCVIVIIGQVLAITSHNNEKEKIDKESESLKLTFNKKIWDKINDM